MAKVYDDNQHQNLRDQNVDLSVHFILVISWQVFDGYSLSHQKIPVMCDSVCAEKGLIFSWNLPLGIYK